MGTVKGDAKVDALDGDKDARVAELERRDEHGLRQQVLGIVHVGMRHDRAPVCSVPRRRACEVVSMRERESVGWVGGMVVAVRSA
jgi:hypothetical protein